MMDNKAISFEECAEKLGHCWNDAAAYLSAEMGLRQHCRHCGASRQRAPDWQAPEPPPTHIKEER